VVLLGTGSADGWPNPFCTCASCTAVRGTDDIRGNTSALVDDVLLLDCGPDAPRTAARLGVSLHRVRHLLLTHAHPDHVGPAALLWRRWADRGEPLDVVGTPDALALCREWVGPDEPVRWRPVSPGGVLRQGGYEMRALPAAHEDGALLWDVTGPDGARLLYATDTGPPPDGALAAVTGRAYGLVLLEETFGTVTDHGTGHLDLATFPLAVAALRRAGAVADGTRVIAVHLGHRNPPPGELATRLAAWGAVLPRDGDVVEVPGTLSAPAGAGERPRRTLVLGGARAGKSSWAEAVLLAETAVTYVATGPSGSDDPEWTQRLAAHRARRPAAWRTVETADVDAELRSAEGAVLVDDIGNWLTQALDRAGAWDDPAALPEVRARAEDLVAAWRAARGRVVAVSNEVGGGVVRMTRAGRLFRDELGRLNARLAAGSDEVVLLVAGVPVPLRPAAGRAASRPGPHGADP